ncbi:hypothetical protein WP7S18E06_01040 [Aeromonas hydrophila]|nr:hypothetical protein AO056_01845 [Aeromonas hydrophila]BBT04605.1 hypothetical protein WP7S18E06_01040 [Aeromonas hydrophila]
MPLILISLPDTGVCNLQKRQGSALAFTRLRGV